MKEVFYDVIIDADTHISPTPEPSSIGYDELIRRMDRSGVAKAVVWLQPPYSREIDPANRYVFEATRAHPDRVLGFGWADPNLGVDKAKSVVKRCLDEYGFFGVKLNGAQNNFYIDDPVLSLPVIEEIAKTGKILAFHVGTDAYEQTHPFRVAKIAALYPGMTIFVVHMGGVAHADMSNATIEFAEKHPNLILIGSAVRSYAILKAVRTLGAERVCFGSDTPFEPMHVETARYEALLDDEVSEAEKSLIMGGNIARAFKLTV